MPIKIVRIKNFKPKNPIVIVGVPGSGLVGSIAAAHMVDVLGMDFVAYFSSPEFAPLAAIHDYTPMPAARVHYSPKLDLFVILSEMTIPTSLVNDFADSVLQFAKKVNAKKIISVGGVSLGEENQIYVIGSSKDLVKDIVSKKLGKPIKEGATSGVTGVLLTKGFVNRFPVLSLLSESTENFVDPHAAAQVLQILGRYIKVKIDVSQLERDAQTLAKEMREKVAKAKVLKPEDSMYG